MRRIVALSLLAAACGPASETSAPQREFEPSTARIIPSDSHPHRLYVCQAERSYDERWVPSQEDIDLLDPVLIELIEYRLKEDFLTYEDSAEMRPERYHRDYFGLVRGGERFILICGQYESTPVYAHDGGPWRFATLYDVRRRRFVSFEFGYRA